MKIRLTLLLAGCLCTSFLSAQRTFSFRQYFLGPRVVSTTLSNQQNGFDADKNRRAAFLSELEYGQPFRKKQQLGWSVALGAGRRDQIPLLNLPVAEWNTLGYPTALPVRFRQSTLQFYTAKTGINLGKTWGNKFRLQGKLGPGISYIKAVPGNKIQLLLPYYVSPGTVPNIGTAETSVDRQSVFFWWGDLGFSYRIFKRVHILGGFSVLSGLTPFKSTLNIQFHDPQNSETIWADTRTEERFQYTGGHIGLAFEL